MPDPLENPPWNFLYKIPNHCRFEHSVGNGCGTSKNVVTVVKAAALPKGAGRLAWLAER